MTESRHLGPLMCPEFEHTPNFRSDTAVSRYETLLEMADTLAHEGALPDLLSELARRLKSVVVFDSINFSLYDEFRKKMVLKLWQGPGSPPPGTRNRSLSRGMGVAEPEASCLVGIAACTALPRITRSPSQPGHAFLLRPST